MVILDQVKQADKGVFKVTDMLGFAVSTNDLKVQRKETQIKVGRGGCMLCDGESKTL